jgi:hypothetical protein
LSESLLKFNVTNESHTHNQAFVKISDIGVSSLHLRQLVGGS